MAVAYHSFRSEEEEEESETEEAVVEEEWVGTYSRGGSELSRREASSFSSMVVGRGVGWGLWRGSIKAKLYHTMHTRCH